MTTRELLEKGRALIEKPEDWKQGGLATLDLQQIEAVAPFCSLGALGKAGEILGIGGSNDRQGRSWAPPNVAERNYGNQEILETYRAAAKLLHDCMGDEVHEYNDKSEHACVLEAFNLAIEKATEQECSSQSQK